ncbi:MAG: acyl-CoA reductase [Candidatus Marinimicrobia bacterium]|nr:acyl-CoA reductase [Candidatus Neomarinimicrobiota bacterium]
MIRIPENIKKKISFIIGSSDNVSNMPVIVYDEIRVRFLSDLSRSLLGHSDIRQHPDVATFAFWCRKSNLNKIMGNHSTTYLRVGLGMVYHNTPSNVPVNFAFSLAFGFLSGNTCVVRLSSKESDSASIIVNVLSDLLDTKKYSEIRKFIFIIKFNRDDEVNKFWMSVADARVIWGGDETVAKMRTFPCKPRSREIVFPDRFSLCVINAIKLIEATDNDLKKLCESLFNDVYIMDQNACSSPQLFNWVGNDSIIKKAKNRLWPLFSEYVNQIHSIEPIQYMDKYVDACRNALSNDNVKSVRHENNLLFNIELSHFHDQQQNQRGYFGTIHEISIKNLDELVTVIDDRCQTLTYFGFDIKELKNFVVSNQLRGIDRIVPIGGSLDMDVIWDGYDIIDHLSRTIDIY